MSKILAFLLINVIEDERGVLAKIKKLPNVKEAHVLFGEWDILAKVEIESSEELGTFVMDKIRPIKKIKITSTLIVAK